MSREWPNQGLGFRIATAGLNSSEAESLSHCDDGRSSEVSRILAICQILRAMKWQMEEKKRENEATSGVAGPMQAVLAAGAETLEQKSRERSSLSLGSKIKDVTLLGGQIKTGPARFFRVIAPRETSRQSACKRARVGSFGMRGDARRNIR